jgi:hypothetical protein
LINVGNCQISIINPTHPISRIISNVAKWLLSFTIEMEDNKRISMISSLDDDRVVKGWPKCIKINCCWTFEVVSVLKDHLIY